MIYFHIHTPELHPGTRELLFVYNELATFICAVAFETKTNFASQANLLLSALIKHKKVFFHLVFHAPAQAPTF